MKHRLDFASFTLLPSNIIEVIIDNYITLSLENVEACYQFIETHIPNDFSLLINGINDYTYSFEAKLSVASHEKLKAVAFVYYNQNGQDEFESLLALRAVDNLNANVYSGLELGWQEAHQWLEQEMEKANITTKTN